jgi:hypothetical protein
MRMTVRSMVMAMAMAMAMAGAAGGCRAPATGLVVEVTTDIPADMLAGFTVLVRRDRGAGADAETVTSVGVDGSLTGPVRVALVPTGAVGGPFTVEIDGYKDPNADMPLAERKAIVSFWPEHVVLLPITLFKECVGKLPCGPDQTCGSDGKCQDIPTFDPKTLPPVTAPPTGTPDTGTDAGSGADRDTAVPLPDALNDRRDVGPDVGADFGADRVPDAARDAVPDTAPDNAVNACTQSPPPSGCCRADNDCQSPMRCYAADCTQAKLGRCLMPPVGGCFDERDCNSTFPFCMGAVVCGCGVTMCVDSPTLCVLF